MNNKYIKNLKEMIQSDKTVIIEIFNKQKEMDNPFFGLNLIGLMINNIIECQKHILKNLKEV